MPAFEVQRSPLWELQMYEYIQLSTITLDGAPIPVLDEVTKENTQGRREYIVLLGADDPTARINKAGILHRVTSQYRITSKYAGFQMVKRLVGEVFSALSAAEPVVAGFVLNRYTALVVSLFRFNDETEGEARAATVQILYELKET